MIHCRTCSSEPSSWQSVPPALRAEVLDALRRSADHWQGVTMGEWGAGASDEKRAECLALAAAYREAMRVLGVGEWAR